VQALAIIVDWVNYLPDACVEAMVNDGWGNPPAAVGDEQWKEF